MARHGRAWLWPWYSRDQPWLWLASSDGSACCGRGYTIPAMTTAGHVRAPRTKSEPCLAGFRRPPQNETGVPFLVEISTRLGPLTC